MSCQRVAIPMNTGSAFDRFAREHMIKFLSENMLVPYELEDLESSVQSHENVLIDDEFIEALKPNIIKQFTPEQIESIRGRTAKRVVVSKQGSEVKFSLEF